MAGTITVDTVSNGAGTKTISTSNLVDGSAKAWVNFNGTGTVAIRASFNVLSITDNGVGDYTVNLTTALPDANYNVDVTGSASGVTGVVLSRYENTATARTSSLLRIGCTNGNTGTATDDTNISVTFFR